MAEIITNLHPDGDENTNLYPNIKKENIPSKSISTDKLDDNVLSLIGSLKPSGTDISTNILAYTSNKGIYVATDNGHWYYWNGSAYADGGVYENSEDIEQIKKDLNDLSLIESTIEIAGNGWIRYSNGEFVASSATYYYKLSNDNTYSRIKAFLTSDTNVLCAIAFYTTDDISTDGYIKEASVDFMSGVHNDGLWYVADVPSSCKTIVLVTKVPSETVASPKFYLGNQQVVSKIDKKVISLQNDIVSLQENKWFDYPLENYGEGWVRHGTGEIVPSKATWYFSIPRGNIKKIRAFTKSDTSIIDMFAYYSTEEISTESYLQSSVSWGGLYPQGKWYEETIPDEAKLVVVSVVKPSNDVTPRIMFLTNEVLNVTDVRYLEKINTIQYNLNVIDRNLYAKPLFRTWRNMYHYGMNSVATRTDIAPVIPSQSIYDVRYAKKLGFDFIEANLHKTKDNQYVVTHGVNGGLGHDFDTLNGEDAFGTSIAGNTLSYLQTNFVYRSSVADYRIPITTLEDFLHECAKVNIGVMLQYIDTTSMNLALGIMGENRLIMYNAPRKYYKGAILEYLSYTTKDEIVSHCESIGIPYIYSMANPTAFDDETLKDIVQTLHLKGFHIATAYVSDVLVEKLSSFGFDIFALDGTARQLNNNQTVLDGKVLTFNEDGTVSWETL